MSTITIDINDVIAADNSVEKAITKAADELFHLADSSATGGKTRTASNGVKRFFDRCDYARVAIKNTLEENFSPDGALQPSDFEVLDPKTGCIGNGIDEFDSEGEWTGKIEWGCSSQVCIEVPEIEEAVEFPEVFASMAKMAFRINTEYMEFQEWVNLISKIRRCADLVKDIDTEYEY